jgi:DNA-binding NtrC family response regulator
MTLATSKGHGAPNSRPIAVFLGHDNLDHPVVLWLKNLGYVVQAAPAEEDLEVMSRPEPDILVYAGSGISLINLRARFPRTMFILVPLEAAENWAAVSPVELLEPTYDEPPLRGSERIVGTSRSADRLRKLVARVAGSDSGTLIIGETGTGKELIAELIHLNSCRSQKPFVCVNCAAIPEALIESELFGFERGAFTGAVTRVSGKLLLAQGGILFLDEIGELTMAAQAKLLRAIEGKPIYLLGGQRPVELDVRVVAATNRDLEKDVQEGRFRQDLYYRLNILQVQTTPLRERLDDLPSLVRHFIGEFNIRSGANVQSLTPESMSILFGHTWPGNVRELRNVVEASFAHRRYRTQAEIQLPEELCARFVQCQRTADGEKEMILKTLAATGWNRSKTAASLRLSRMTLYRKMDRYGLTAVGGSSGEAPKKPVSSGTQPTGQTKAAAG